MILLDDGPARRAAHTLGLHVVGTAGVVLAAKKLALVPSVRPILDTLTALGFRMAPALKRVILTAAGEGDQ